MEYIQKGNKKALRISHSFVYMLSTFTTISKPLFNQLNLIYLGRAHIFSLKKYLPLILLSLIICLIYIYLLPRLIKVANKKTKHPLFQTLSIFILMLLMMVVISFLFSNATILFSQNSFVWFGLLISIVGSFILIPISTPKNESLIPVLLFSFFTIAVYIISQVQLVTDYPLSLGWSETSHYAYGYSFYSLFKGDDRILLPYMNHSRYLLLSIPWFINQSNILIHRIWETLLSIIFPLLTSYLLIKRFQLKSILGISLFFWGWIFILQGPIYYHLLLIPLFIFWLYDINSPNRFILIFALSIWAGFSRINWLPMPMAISIVIYLYESMKLKGLKDSNREIITEILKIMIFGFLGGGIGYGLVYLVSNQFTALIASAFSSSLLWNRLLPSPIYGLGILLTILIVSLPGLLIIFFGNKRILIKEYRLRHIIILTILLIFLLGGLLVSIKIGGGADIHNLDGFILILLISIMFELDFRYDLSKKLKIRSRVFTFIIPFLFVLPGFFILPKISAVQIPDKSEAKVAIRAIQELIDESEGRLLLVTEQHLILFGEITGIEYPSLFEKTLIMEATMSYNIKYINKTNLLPLMSQEYEYLITEPQQWNIKDPQENMFAEENNNFIRIYSKEFRKLYTLSYTMLENYFEVYIPVLKTE